MGKEYKAKVFKSGNSLALRLPKELGFKEGSAMVLREDRSGYRFEPAGSGSIDVTGFAGKAPGIKLAPRREFEERPSVVAGRGAAAE